MDLLKPILVIVFVCSFAHASSQSYSDFIVVDEIFENISELKSEYGNQAKVYWIEGTSVNAIHQISTATQAMQIENLHIYVPTKPGAIVFSSIAITSRNVNELEDELLAWSNLVSNKVVIHSEVVFTGDDGALLQRRLEEITGLSFTAQ